MTAPRLPASDHAVTENELLTRLGLPPSAAPEAVDDLHLAVSEYLAAAPVSIRGWAHAQAAALDAAYLQLTDPVGLQGSALRSPTRPPRVDPGGPATPPARRDFAPPAPPLPVQGVTADVADDDDDVEALYASVTPSAHRDMLPEAGAKSRKTRPLAGAVVVTAQGQSDAGPWKKLFLGGVAVAAVLIAFGIVYNLGGGGKTSPGDTGGTAQASPSAPAIDEAKVAALMAKIQANPNDIVSLQAIANEFYAGGQFQVAGQWLDKLLAIDGKNIEALLARGAVSFNLGDLTAAQATWQQVVTLDPKNVEAHYDLGFMYFYQAAPDYAGVQREWSKVIELDPTSSLAQNAKAHLDALAAKSMIPAASPATSPAASATASPAASPAASAKP